MGEELQADQALLLHPGLLGVSGRHVCRDEAFCRWSRRRVKGTGAAGRGGGGLIGGVIDEAVGSWLAATLHAEGELCLGHGVMEAIDVHAEGVGVCRGETRVTSCSDRNQHVQTGRSMAVKTKPERNTWCPPSAHKARNSQQIIARKPTQSRRGSWNTRVSRQNTREVECRQGGAGGGGGDECDTRTAAGGKEGLKVETVELKVFTESEQQGLLSQRV